nr:MAG TPA: hypothetical protein [Caudoviricetes sp.]
MLIASANRLENVEFCIISPQKRIPFINCFNIILYDKIQEINIKFRKSEKYY